MGNQCPSVITGVLTKWMHEGPRKKEKGRGKDRETDRKTGRRGKEINREVDEGRKRKKRKRENGGVREKCEAFILKMEEATSQE